MLPVAFRLSAGGTVEEPMLHYELYADHPLSETDAAAIALRNAIGDDWAELTRRIPDLAA